MRQWLPENGFLTPTQKIKNASIEDAYHQHKDGWCKAKKKDIWNGF
jgi:long-chain acyl-CoA synthetase